MNLSKTLIMGVRLSKSINGIKKYLNKEGKDGKNIL